MKTLVNAIVFQLTSFAGGFYGPSVSTKTQINGNHCRHQVGFLGWEAIKPNQKDSRRFLSTPSLPTL